MCAFWSSGPPRVVARGGRVPGKGTGPLLARIQQVLSNHLGSTPLVFPGSLASGGALSVLAARRICPVFGWACAPFERRSGDRRAALRSLLG